MCTIGLTVKTGSWLILTTIHVATLYLATWCHRKQSWLIVFSPCKATNLTTRCHRKQSWLIVFSPCKATNLTTWCHRKQSWLIVFSPCKATNLTTWCHRKQSWLIVFSPCKATSLIYLTFVIGKVISKSDLINYHTCIESQDRFVFQSFNKALLSVFGFTDEILLCREGCVIPSIC